jgi:hypothetical protein
MDYGQAATFHLAPDARRLAFAAADADDVAWQRVLLDSVLLCVALLRGRCALHAAAVELFGRAIALVGRSASGKSSVAGALLARGHALVCDDVLVLDAAGAVVRAHAGPPVMNLPAGGARMTGVRLGRVHDEEWVLVDRAVTAPLPLAAVCFLERDAPAGLTLVPGPELTSLHLLAHAPTLGGRAAATRRFELFGEVAERVPLMRLRAAPAVPPEALAGAIETGLGNPLRAAV